MNVSREAHSGLFTLHFSNLFPPEEPVASEGSSSTAGNGESAQAHASSSFASQSPNSISQFSQWHVLIRINVENDVCFVKGDAKVLSATPSLSSDIARGRKFNGDPVVAVTAPDGISIVPIHQKDRLCHVLIEGTGRLDGTHNGITNAFRLQVHFDRLEGAVLGLSEPEMLEVVTLTCGGQHACGWHMGEVSVAVGGKRLKLPQPLRFLLQPYTGKRCTKCLDPVYAIGYSCDDCEMTQYCSRECLNAHMKNGHGLLCPLLKEKYRFKSGMVATEVSNDTGLVAWWRCLENAYYTILVDSRNALGCAVELTLCTLKSAKDEGLQYRFITPKKDASESGQEKRDSGVTAVPTTEEVIDFSCVLLREVNRGAIQEGCVSLAAACLNHLFVFSPCTEITMQAHVFFYYTFCCEEFDGQIATVEEYVTHARPLHELAVSLIEYALKSPLAQEFWQRIKMAKNVLIGLYNVNASVQCSEMHELKDLIPCQQRDTLVLLAKVFVTMAARASKEDARKLLEQAEKCLRECLDDCSATLDDRTHGLLCFRLASLLLLYGDASKNEEAHLQRVQGETLLQEAARPKSLPSPKQHSGADANEQNVAAQ